VTNSSEVRRQQSRRDHAAGLYRKRRHVTLNRRVEIDATALAKLEQCKPRERLGDARYPESGFRSDGDAVLQIGVAERNGGDVRPAVNHERAETDVPLPAVDVLEGRSKAGSAVTTRGLSGRGLSFQHLRTKRDRDDRPA
jgi:hypothetical protein